MIIPRSDSKDSSISESSVEESDSPPSYHSISPGPLSPSSLKPCNFVSVSRRAHSIKGSFKIDPSLRIPAAFLPALADGETEKERQNLRLESRSLNVQADIYLLSNQPVDGRQKVTLTLSSNHGSVGCKVHRDEGLEPPVIINATSKNGSVVVHIPRSFQGLITATTRHGSRPKLSEPLTTQTTTFGNDGCISRYYVGDYDADRLENNLGDELIVESNFGSIKIFYDDEEESSYFNDMVQSARRLLW
ncbi:hypothetical protein K435DRAFT_866055 [Dendrothele bispora CBS 962.96]|uniref:DUF7330 domain-containing protein n=1 Tax=Dendrothele bispora (strain CBS 962.96) TaxID=1314807 RepID=A0A4S8LHV0_DENBC|nr:hypothetical protein K435DRAFT_866055 [Dendrothele bispora CBS 962.96]